jgi:hypothetical protein
MPTGRCNVRYRGQTGKHLLVLSVTAFDPKQTSRLIHARHDLLEQLDPLAGMAGHLFGVRRTYISLEPQTSSQKACVFLSAVVTR